MDAVLMDSYIAPAGIEEHFTEKLIRLDGLRFCYTPPSYAPPLATLPCLYRGHITYGSFNNLAKLTPEVIKIWAEILVATPTSRLILKWKSLGDPDTKSRIQKAFADHGISSKRIDCRGWSGHTQMLTEYNDIDIALDPFPFSGGLTSCDALFMGVPILTLPGALPVSRQTASFMDALGLSDWVTTSQKDYIAKAVAFAANPVFLQSVRQVLRRKMLKSRLCDGKKYAGAIESALYRLAVERGLRFTEKHQCPPSST
jgi:predicted O-linked N-acetylglucosamine transferase (SPINDLY family)